MQTERLETETETMRYRQISNERQIATHMHTLFSRSNILFAKE